MAAAVQAERKGVGGESRRGGGGWSTAVVVGRVYRGRKPASLALEQWETWQPLQTAVIHTLNTHAQGQAFSSRSTEETGFLRSLAFYTGGSSIFQGRPEIRNVRLWPSQPLLISVPYMSFCCVRRTDLGCAGLDDRTDSRSKVS